MIEIKLDAHIINGKIEFSEEQQKKLMVIKSGSPVEIIIRADQTTDQTKPNQRDILKEMAELGYESIIDYLMDYPFDVPNPIRLTREELHER